MTAAGAGWRWRTDLLVAVVLLPRVSRRLRATGYRSTRRWLDERLPGAPEPLDEPADPAASVELARALALVVRLAARLTSDATCLRTSLVLRHLLRRHSLPSTIRLGVRRGSNGGPLSFHAWVEVADVVVSESGADLAGYEVFADDISFDVPL
ncbi:MAG: lasso peptide biosynthesis B2 protein [Acidimicrobiia bacterium]|nr:lasso peptide biosynthesis B2 protein [Acidimicrobiia bacterium]